MQEALKKIQGDPEKTRWLMQQVANEQAGKRDSEEDFDFGEAVIKTIERNTSWLEVVKKGVAKREGDEAGEEGGKGSKGGEGTKTGKGDSAVGNKGAGKEGSKGAGAKGKGRNGREEVWHVARPGRTKTLTHTPDEQEQEQRVIKRKNVRTP